MGAQMKEVGVQRTIPHSLGESSGKRRNTYITTPFEKSEMQLLEKKLSLRIIVKLPHV
jgi:hypothetical protein